MMRRWIWILVGLLSMLGAALVVLVPPPMLKPAADYDIDADRIRIRSWKWAIVGLVGALGVAISLVVPRPSLTAADEVAIYAVSMQAMQSQLRDDPDRRDHRLTVNADRSDGIRFSAAWIAAAPFSVQPNGDVQLSPIRINFNHIVALRIAVPGGCGAGSRAGYRITLVRVDGAWTITSLTYDGGLC